MMGKRSLLIKAVMDLKKRCEVVGLKLNLAKTIGWDPSLEEETATVGGINWVKDGVKILGGPIGGALSGSSGADLTFASQFAKR